MVLEVENFHEQSDGAEDRAEGKLLEVVGVDFRGAKLNFDEGNPFVLLEFAVAEKIHELRAELQETLAAQRDDFDEFVHGCDELVAGVGEDCVGVFGELRF